MNAVEGPSLTLSTIDDYAVIGDCRSAALISRDGSLDWLCWPRFDSPAIFAAILDPDTGGRWQISVGDTERTTRRYLPETNVLETRVEAGHGVITLTDFMPLADDAYRAAHLSPDRCIVRQVRCESGSADVTVRFAPRPGFAKGAARVVDCGKLGLRVSLGHAMVALHTTIPFEIDGGAAATSTTTLQAGQEFAMVLTFADASPEVLPVLSDVAASTERTVQWWREWAKAFKYDGRAREAVLRSALVLKLLEFPASGAIIAAATTSLPERIGGQKNWDYRYCWLRDASFTMEALLGVGFIAEAEAFAEWMLHATRLTQPKLMVMYDVYGNIAPPKRDLEHLSGYRNSKPVNTGNPARKQTQLDTYGEVIDAVAKLLCHQKTPADRETSRVLVGFGRYVCKHWSEPDSGIWEKAEKKLYTYSRLLCWLALEKLLDLHERGLIGGVPVEMFKAARSDIRRAIEVESWDAQAKGYSSEPGKFVLDATLLLIAVHKFDDAASERMQQTRRWVEERLGAGGALLYRYLPDEEREIEGAFGICGFWRVIFLAIGGGSLAEAEAAFDELSGDRNDVGLFAEEVDPSTRAAVGNFPQGFTHVGLIIAAMAIERRRRGQAPF